MPAALHDLTLSFLNAFENLHSLIKEPMGVDLERYRKINKHITEGIAVTERIGEELIDALALGGMDDKAEKVQKILSRSVVSDDEWEDVKAMLQVQLRKLSRLGVERATGAKESTAVATKKKRSSRGRQQLDPVFDRRVRELRETGRFPLNSDIARELNCLEKDVRESLDRSRKPARKK